MPSTARFVSELIAAVRELNGLDQLNHHRLAALAEAAAEDAEDFAAECQHAWNFARPPSPEDLEQLDRSPILWDDDSAVIEWNDVTDGHWVPVSQAHNEANLDRYGSETDEIVLGVVLNPSEAA